MIGKCEISGIDKLRIGQYGEGEGRGGAGGGERKGEIGRCEISGVKGWIYRREKMYNTDKCELLGEEKFRKVKEKGRIELCENSK